MTAREIFRGSDPDPAPGSNRIRPAAVEATLEEIEEIDAENPLVGIYHGSRTTWRRCSPPRSTLEGGGDSL